MSVMKGSPATAWRRVVAFAALFATLIGLTVSAGAARADGDPGSDVLLAQNLFSTTLTPVQQEQLGKLLDATARAGTPIRVAIISNQDEDLGTVTELWKQPQDYAWYLGNELSLAYTGRLLVVMPNGYGLYWHGVKGKAAKLIDLMARYRPSSTTPAGYLAATEAAVYLLESKAGVSRATLMRDAARVHGATPAITWQQPIAATTPLDVTNGSSSGSNTTLVIVLLVVLLALGVAFVLVARRRGMRVRGVNVFAAGVLALVVIGALVISQTRPSTSALGNTLATNPNLDPGTSLGDSIEAPNFTLTDETGRRVSLSQYRGKVVVLSFVDAECQTVCPLTTQAMLDAKAALGTAGKDVVLLGVNANWKSVQIDDVLNYTELHGMLGRWHFLTSSSLPALERVWTAYHVNEKALDKANDNDIEHVTATYIIGPRGMERYTFTTAESYAAIGQFGGRIAQRISEVLPSHPAVHMTEPYGEIRGVTPTETVQLPKLGGGSVTLGPGRPRLYMFFATWDAQSTPIASHLDQELNAYAASAARLKLPGVTAIDEGSVEPSPRALPEFVSRLPVQLRYPVAIDATGRIADGYDVNGEPWFVLVNSAGKIIWYEETYLSTWPKLATLQQQVKAALTGGLSGPLTRSVIARDLSGSPAPLAALHRQSSQLLSGGQNALDKRIRQLRDHTIVLNIWASDCEPCQNEATLFERASAEYGRRIAFIGADFNDVSSSAARNFLLTHPVSYPSYAVTSASMTKLLVGGVGGTPSTVYIGPNGKIESIHTGVYETQGGLDQDIENAEIGGS